MRQHPGILVRGRTGQKIPPQRALRDFRGIPVAKSRPFPKKVVSDSGAYESSLTAFDLLGRVAPRDGKIPPGFARRDFVQGLQATKKKRPCP